ncbi:hypothetical protein LTSEADE_0302, partial [Salmonella enterica subsp. enterica serovar Adelaide str. A4-669]
MSIPFDLRLLTRQVMWSNSKVWLDPTVCCVAG